MKRIGTILLVIVAIFAFVGGGKYLGMAALTILAPIYALLLASIFFIVFLIAAAIAVEIDNHMVDRPEARAVSRKEPTQRRAA